MPDALIGRDTELAVVRGFLERPVTAARALVIVGEAGIGKSALWDVALAAARERFAVVLASRPVEAEVGLAHVVLGDLLAGIPSGLLARLIPARRRAVEAALLLGSADDSPVDPRALGVALVDVLHLLASEGPVALAIDDDHWADRSSIASLSFALRRLGDDPILLILARREPGGSGRLEGTLDRTDIVRLPVGPLSLGALASILKARLGAGLSRPALARVYEASAGNPLFAIEVARGHSNDALVDRLTPLEVPAELEHLIAARLAGLPPETRAALLLAAAHGRPTLSLLDALGAHHALEPAYGAGIVARSGDVVRFTHPLMSSVLYQEAGPADRRDAHRRLAAHIADPLQRARHTALATDRPDQDVAAELEASAELARVRGAPIMAAELAELAQRLTPDDDAAARQRRGLLAGRAHLEAGAADRAREIAEALAAGATSPAARAEARILLADLEPVSTAVALLEEALIGASNDPRLAAEVHITLADIGRFDRGRDWAEQQARDALSLAESLDDVGLRAGASAISAVLRFEHLEPGALELAREAHRLARSAGDPRLLRQARWAVGHLLTWMRRTDEARAWLEQALAEVGESDELSRAELLWYLGLVDLWAGRWPLARAHAEEFMATALQYGVEQAADHFPIALIALHQGDLDVARAHARRGLEIGEHFLRAAPLEILGLAEVWEGRPDEALRYLDEADRLKLERGQADPGQALAWVDHVEALLQVGQIDDAAARVAEWEARARRVRRGWALAQALRARGLIAAARGDLEAAARLLDEAAGRQQAVGDPFGHAQALLALGTLHRRRRQKRLSRTTLEAALERFGSLGASMWVARTRAELGRLGGHRRFVELSPSERRVAELVAEGRTNREVASALFLSERTVASHLTRTYSKLGVRSRTELARHFTQAGEGRR